MFSPASNIVVQESTACELALTTERHSECKQKTRNRLKWTRVVWTRVGNSTHENKAVKGEVERGHGFGLLICEKQGGRDWVL